MLPTSQNYRDAIYANTRRTVARVRFSFTDPEAPGAARLVQVPPEREVSRKHQILLGKPESVGEIATFEPDFWKLDGSFMLPRTDTPGVYGLRTQVLSDSTGMIVNSPILRISFAEAVSMPGLSLFFDPRDGQYATLVRMDGKLGVSLVHSVLRENAGAVMVVDEGFANIDVLEISFLSTNEPNRGVRLLGLLFGLYLAFEDATLFNASTVAEVDITGRTLPRNELNVSVVNLEGRFSYGAENGYSQYLQMRQAVQYDHGLALPTTPESVEWVACGEYALESWRVDDRHLELRARTGTYSALQTTYTRSSLTDYISIGDAMSRVLEHSGVSYEIAEELIFAPRIRPYTGVVTCETALLALCRVAGAFVRVDPNTGIVHVHAVDRELAAVDKIMYDNSFENPRLELGRYHNAIALETTAVAAGANQTLLVKKHNNAGTTEHWFPLDQSAAPGAQTAVTGATLISADVYSDFVRVTVSGDGAFTLTVTGPPASFKKSTTIIDAPWRLPGEPVVAYPLSAPMLIRESGMEGWLGYVTEKTLGVMQYRLNTTVGWRQNPALETGDTVSLQTDMNRSTRPFLTSRHERVYRGGALRGITQAVAKEEVARWHGTSGII